MDPGDSGRCVGGYVWINFFTCLLYSCELESSVFTLQAFLHEIKQSGFCVAICIMVDKVIQEKRSHTSIQGIVSWVHHEQEGISSARSHWWYLFLNCVHSFFFLLLLVSFSVSRSFMVLLFAWAALRITCKSESMVWLDRVSVGVISVFCESFICLCQLWGSGPLSYIGHLLY